MKLADYERSLIGCVLVDNAAADRIGVTAEDFETERHREVYRSARSIIDQGRAADYISVLDDLEKRGVQNVEASWFADFGMPTGANVAFYADKVREAARARQLRRLAMGAIESLDWGGSSAEALDELERGITGFDKRATEARLIQDIFPEVVERIEKLYHAEDGIIGVPSGFTDLDELTLGFEAESLVVVAARASIGKTALALQMANNMWFKAKIPVGFFSCEMSAASLVIRILASEARFQHSRIRSGMLSEMDFSAIVEFGGKIDGARYWIDDTPSIKLQDLRSSARRMARQGAKAIFVDYLTLIRHGKPQTPRHERVGEISKSLKNLARELHVPVIALSQLGREAEGSRPSLAHLRQSGEIEEDADLVLLMSRDRNQDPHMMQEVELIVAKNRNGPTGTVSVMLDPRYTRFEPAARQHDQPDA